LITSSRQDFWSDIIVFMGAGYGFAVFAWLVVTGGDDIGAGEPTIEVNIGAALGAERLKGLDGRSAADRALSGLRHQTPDKLD
jgi:hypothetical protein